MTAKEYLHQLHQLNRLVESKMEKLEMLKLQATQCSSILSKSSALGTKNLDPLKIVDKYLDLEMTFAQDLARLLYKQNEIVKKIDQLEDETYKLILTLRYVNFKTFEEISLTTNYHPRHIQRLHKKALLYFEESYPQIKAA